VAVVVAVRKKKMRHTTSYNREIFVVNCIPLAPPVLAGTGTVALLPAAAAVVPQSHVRGSVQMSSLAQ